MRHEIAPFLFSPTAVELLPTLRIVLALSLLPFHYLQFHHFLSLDPAGPAFHFVDPIWYFGLLGVQSVPVPVALACFYLLFAATLSFALGLFTRSSLVLMLVLILALKGARDSTAGDVHHRYLIPFNVLLIFALSRCGDLWSVDAWRARRRGVVRHIEGWEAAWPVRAAQVYIAGFYFVSAIAKLRMTGWVWGSAERIQGLLLTRSMRLGIEDGVPTEGSRLAFELAQSPLVCELLAHSTYVFEFGFPLILFVRSFWLRAAFLAGVTGFHVANYFLINVQFLFMPLLFVVFFDVSKPVLQAREWWAKRMIRRLPA